MKLLSFAPLALSSIALLLAGLVTASPAIPADLDGRTNKNSYGRNNKDSYGGKVLASSYGGGQNDDDHNSYGGSSGSNSHNNGSNYGGNNNSGNGNGNQNNGGKSNNCGSGMFYYGEKDCCLQNGGPPANQTPPPPPGKQCPSNWYWHTGQSCCTPRTPPTTPSPPTCPPKCTWNQDDYSCHTSPPSPQPSGSYHKSGKKRNASLCPYSLTACPFRGLSSSEYECIDTTTELSSCGGCASTGQGQDCSEIPNSWNVGCSSGSCVVYTCEGGYIPSLDGLSCIPY